MPTRGKAPRGPAVCHSLNLNGDWRDAADPVPDVTTQDSAASALAFIATLRPWLQEIKVRYLASMEPTWGSREMLLTALVMPAEDGGFRAVNPETGATTQGETVDEAVASLREATELYLEEFPLVVYGPPLLTAFEANAATSLERKPMPLVSETSIRLAIKNIASHGDTDIFPFPIENHLFHDKPDDVCKVLQSIDDNFSNALSRIPVLAAKELAAVGYAGFRQGTQLDPLWNAYLLSLVVDIGDDIEARRVPPSIVFSYRFKPDPTSGALFDKTVGWPQFQEAICTEAREHSFVLRCDIADFYPRIYHHRLENALALSTTKAEVAKRIMELVKKIAAGPSYGLPVGGPAARILSELVLNRVDRLLVSQQIKFRRFVDDYVIFASSREEAQSALIKLTQDLLTNEGLSLQKAKTRVMTTSEFLATSEFGESPEGEAPEDERARTFRKLRIHFDPYSPTAEEDYKVLADELSRFDIVGMLGRELAKSRIDEGLTRRLLSAIRLLPPSSQNDAVRSMLASLDLLYPIFPAVMRLCRAISATLEADVRKLIFREVRGSIQSKSYITQVPANLAFALRVLSQDDSEETEILLASVFRDSRSMMIRRDVILIMANRHADHWVSDCKNSFPTANGWERRALLIASYILGDEGEHWRRPLKKEQSGFDQLLMSWTDENKKSKGPTWRVPV